MGEPCSFRACRIVPSSLTQQITEYMERERKFFVTRMPSGLIRHPHTHIRQGYLATSKRRDPIPIEVRVRDEDGTHVLTVKSGIGGCRSETEVSINAAEFRALWPLTVGKRLKKVRYRIPMGKLTVELDVYHGPLKGLLTAEVEFESARQYRNFRPPRWLGHEVTGRDKFSNSRLAASAGPPTL